MTGPERALLYRVAAETGLRQNELRSLLQASFDLTAGNPSVTVEASYSKRRRRDTLPLRPDLAEALRSHLRAKTPEARAFSIPRQRHLLNAYLKDLEDAGIA